MPCDPGELQPLLEWSGTWGGQQQLLGSAEYGRQLGFLPAGLRLMSSANGFRFWFSSEDRETRGMMSAGAYEPTTVALLARLVRSGMRCLNIGAQTGLYTCNLARLVKPEGCVTIFEPARSALEPRRLSVEKNCWTSRVSLRDVACADTWRRAACLDRSETRSLTPCPRRAAAFPHHRPRVIGSYPSDNNSGAEGRAAGKRSRAPSTA